MFLLFLIGLGTADVNAQVRIGGNSAPQGAAVLDLNADNTATPTANKGALALPRVRLDSTTMKLNGTTPIIGMLVWNTNNTLGVGIYYWSGSAWIQASLPVTSASDSGKRIAFDGTKWVTVHNGFAGPAVSSDTIYVHPLCDTLPCIVVDTTVEIRTTPGYTTTFTARNLDARKMVCTNAHYNTLMRYAVGTVLITNIAAAPLTNPYVHVTCWQFRK